MTTCRWTNDLELAHPTLDDDHRRLVDALGQIVAMLNADPGCETVVESLRALAVQTREHFAIEEIIMEWVGFPSAATHAAAHHGLLIQLRVMTDLIADGSMEADSSAVDFLASWLIDHHCGHDRELADFISGWKHTQSLQSTVKP